MKFALIEPSHVFALFYQIRRAFKHIFDYIIGGFCTNRTAACGRSGNPYSHMTCADSEQRCMTRWGKSRR